MSSIFTQITKDAEKQRELLERQNAAAQPVVDSIAESVVDSFKEDFPAPLKSTAATTRPAPDSSPVENSAHREVSPPSGAAVPHAGATTVRVKKQTRRSKTADIVEEARLGKGARIDLDKLKIIIEELSVMPTNSHGFNVRLSVREKEDMEDFVLDTLRKEGLKGYEVSTAKLMRYAMRYMFRVHPQEFVTALRAALQVEESLSI